MKPLKLERPTFLAGESKPPPIPCLGHWTYAGDFDCEYAHAGKITCDACVINGGPMDPRTGKRFARRKTP